MGQNFHLIVGSHAHVPFGAGDDEFEQTYALKLKPFISTLYKYPKIQLTLHYSGTLLHWIEKVHPEFLMLIEDLVSRKQVELLGGGFYEPMLSLISLQDKIGQIELLTTYLRKQLGKRPQGCWIPALCWEQNLVSPLSASGMAYTFLGEGQFAAAGLSGADLYAPRVSEDQGKLITVFPIADKLKADMAGGSPRGALEKLAAFLENSAFPEGSAFLPDADRVVSVFPEAGADPRGAELYWHEFFEDLSRCDTFLEFTCPGKYLKGRRSLKKAYFPDSRGRQYLIEYPEANGIYSKMVFSHMLINQLRGDKSRKRNAREELWKAQGFDVFFPQGSNGICRSSIRKTAYRALLGAEKITRETKPFIPSLMNFDFDLDGEGEYLFQGERINCYIRPEGAGVFELDYLPKTWNYLDTFNCPAAGSQAGPCDSLSGAPLSRRPVGRRGAFLDRILPAGLSPEDALGRRSSETRFCGGERFEPAEMDRNRGKVSFTLPGKKDVPFGQIGIEKSYQLRKDTLTVSYTLSNRGDSAADFQFAPGIDLSFPGDGEDFMRILKNNGALKPEPDNTFFRTTGAEFLKFQDLKNEVVINLGSSKPFDAYIYPVYSPCEVDGIMVKLYQSTCVIALLQITLNPGEAWKNEFTLKISH